MGPRMREDTDYEWGAFLLNLLGLIIALLCLGERGRAVREPPLRGKVWGWVPACARTREGGIGFVGVSSVGREHTTGDHKGRPYRGWAGWG